MTKAFVPGAAFIAAGGVLIAIYALFIRTEPKSPNIGGGFVVLLAYGLIGAGVVLLVVQSIGRSRRR